MDKVKLKIYVICQELKEVLGDQPAQEGSNTQLAHAAVSDLIAEIEREAGKEVLTPQVAETFIGMEFGDRKYTLTDEEIRVMQRVVRTAVPRRSPALR